VVVLAVPGPAAITEPAYPLVPVYLSTGLAAMLAKLTATELAVMVPVITMFAPPFAHTER